DRYTAPFHDAAAEPRQQLPLSGACTLDRGRPTCREDALRQRDCRPGTHGQFLERPGTLTGGEPMTHAGAPGESGIITAGKSCLRSRIEGSGTPTLVVGSAIYYPRTFSQNLRRHLRLVCLDHRGFAPSPGPVDTGEFALDAILDDTEKARRELG